MDDALRSKKYWLSRVPADRGNGLFSQENLHRLPIN
jgi:hypothetical protein